MTDPRTSSPQASQRQLAVRTVESLDELQKRELLVLFERLLDLRERPVPAIHKLREVLTSTQNQKAVLAVLHRSAGQVKDLAWDDRTWAARLGLSAALVTSVATAGQGAGIAMLGTAIGVPLWVVFGAGGTFAGVIVEEIQKSLSPDDLPKVLDADQADLIEEADFEILSVELPQAATRLLAAAEAAAGHESAPGPDDKLEPSRKLARLFSAVRKRRGALIGRFRR